MPAPDVERAIVNLRAALLKLHELEDALRDDDRSVDPIALSLLGHADALVTASIEAIGGKAPTLTPEPRP